MRTATRSSEQRRKRDDGFAEISTMRDLRAYSKAVFPLSKPLSVRTLNQSQNAARIMLNMVDSAVYIHGNTNRSPLPQGTCSGYPALLKHLATSLAEAANSEITGETAQSAISALLATAVSCPLCRWRTKSEAEAIAAVTHRLIGKQRATAEFPLCGLPHSSPPLGRWLL